MAGKITASYPDGIALGRLRSILGFALAEHERPKANVRADIPPEAYSHPPGHYSFIITDVVVDEKTGDVTLKLEARY